MNQRHDGIGEAAIGWAVRSRDPGFTDWDGFTTWLEADPAHSDAYDIVMLAGDDAAALLASVPPAHIVSLPTPANDEPAQGRPARTSRRGLIGFAVAASLLALTSYSWLRPDGGAFQTIRTAQGERRTITLADGSLIEVNGGSTLLTDPDRPRFAKLEAGEAAFIVVHDAQHPFVVETGDALLQDAGTAFNVRRIDGSTEVAVSEGLVIYNPASEAVRLAPGRRLRVADGGAPVVGAVATDAVAGWREGRLVYDGATLGDVAADLSRNTGQHVGVAPAIAGQAFSGIITLDGGNQKLFQRLGPLLGVEVNRNDQGWMLTSKP